jgi:hypothetical protein
VKKRKDDTRGVGGGFLCGGGSNQTTIKRKTVAGAKPIKSKILY